MYSYRLNGEPFVIQSVMPVTPLSSFDVVVGLVGDTIRKSPYLTSNVHV